jgi:hypothetical protein
MAQPTNQPHQAIKPAFNMLLARRLFSSAPRSWKGLPTLPYVNNTKYLDTLDEFNKQRPVKSTLVVWGPKSVSKSGGLQLKMKVLFAAFF